MFVLGIVIANRLGCPKLWPGRGGTRRCGQQSCPPVDPRTPVSSGGWSHRRS